MIIFRKRLMIDTDAGELARVKSVLDKNAVRYDVKTTVSDNVLSRSFNSAAAVRHRSSYSAMETQSYVYQLFVSLKDYDRAKALAYGSSK